MNTKRWLSLFALGGIAAAWAAFKIAEQTPHGMAPPAGPKRRAAVKNNASHTNGW